MKMKELEIRHHNAITTARYEYSELQMDIFFYLLSKLRKNEPNGVYEIVVKDLSAITGKRYSYPYLRKATESMGSRMFEVENDREYDQLWMFQRIRYIKGAGRIELKLAEDIQPYLFDLRNNFTSFQLYSALRLTSKYAKRIYSICSQWKDIGHTKKFAIVDLKRMLHLIDEKNNEQFERISDFKRFVLDEAVKQINQHTDLRISYELEKRGRAFENVTFDIKAQPMNVVLPDLGPTDQLSDQKTQNAARILDELRISDAHLRTRILSDPNLIQAVNKFGHDLKTGKIKASRNPAGLLLTVLGLKTTAKAEVS